MAIDAMYTEVIMMHNRSAHNKGVLSTATAMERGHNPNCGDDLTLFLEVKDNLVVDAKYAGSGCAISQASVSIMIDMIKGLSVEEAKSKADLFLRMIRGETLTETDKTDLGDAVIFEGLSHMPARVKCGTLGWHCLQVTLDK